jgi:hypothetical protein
MDAILILERHTIEIAKRTVLRMEEQEVVVLVVGVLLALSQLSV